MVGLVFIGDLIINIYFDVEGSVQCAKSVGYVFSVDHFLSCIWYKWIWDNRTLDVI